MNNSISDIIISRIHFKKMNHWAKVKSLTLGIEIYQKLRDEMDCLRMAYYTMMGADRLGGLEFHDYPIKISYKRPRLIQVNMGGKRRKINYWKPWPYNYEVLT